MVEACTEQGVRRSGFVVRWMLGHYRSRTHVPIVDVTSSRRMPACSSGTNLTLRAGMMATDGGCEMGITHERDARCQTLSENLMFVLPSVRATFHAFVPWSPSSIGLI